MSQTYRIRIRQPARRRWAYLLLVAGAACLYLASISFSKTAMKVEIAPGVLVTQEQILPEHIFSIVTLTSGSDRACMQAESARYAARGASGALWHSGGLYHAAGAVFADAEAALSAAQILSAAEGVPAQTLPVRIPGPVLRITATKQQLAALTEADSLLYSAAMHLGDLAAKTDSGEIDFAGAKAILSAQQNALADMYDRLHRLVSGEREPAAQTLVRLLENAAEGTRELSEAQGLSRLQLSSQIRALQLSLLQEFCAWRTDL